MTAAAGSRPGAEDGGRTGDADAAAEEADARYEGSAPAADIDADASGAAGGGPAGEAGGADQGGPPAGEPGEAGPWAAEGEPAAADLGVGDVVEQLRTERDEYLDALRRLQADFENYRKRVQRQQEEAVARAAERLVVALLPALDAFDLAAEHLVGDEQVSPGGLLQAAALLRDALAKEGLERVGEVGDPFDPNAHEAVEHTADDGGDGPVVDTVLRSGYRFNGRTVRPAMVKVRG